MQVSLYEFVVVAVAAMASVFLTWVVMRGRIAVAAARGSVETEKNLAVALERARSLEEERQHAVAAGNRLREQLEESRRALDAEGEDVARLSERAKRVTVLEDLNVTLAEREQAAQKEILQLSRTEAEKTQQLASTRTRLEEVERDLAEIQQQRDAALKAGNEASESRATLAVQAERIPALETRLADAEQSLVQARAEGADLQAMMSRLKAEAESERHLAVSLRGELEAEKGARRSAEEKANRLATEHAELAATLESERGNTAEKIALLQGAREELANQFKTLAAEILEEKSKRFAESNQTNLGQLLDPLKERMAEFKAKVEEVHLKDVEQQAALKAELGQLKDLNQKITEEAHALATALKGQAKKQGNWGELVLENVLERAGLRENQDYRREVSFNTEEGRKRPDVIVSLPQQKHLVIDAKCSLNAYTRYVNAEDDLARAQALKEHIQAISNRIQELSDRAYYQLPGLNTPEMVFMFIPIESAFVEALRADDSLFQRAIGNNILIATPTTLLTSLNIVRQLWRFEEQNAHTAQLAESAAKVYKKLNTFLHSMQSLGKQIDSAKDTYDKAMGQLYSGRGNLIQQAKDFERLGVSVQSALPEELVARAALELELMPAGQPKELTATAG